MTNFEPKDKPTKIREWIAWFLVKLAKKIYPDSEAVNSFYVWIGVGFLDYWKDGIGLDPNTKIVRYTLRDYARLSHKGRSGS